MYTYTTRLYISFLIAGLTIGIILLVMAVIIIRYQRRYRKLQHNYFTDEAELLQKERKRIAGDFHDKLGAILTLTLRQVDIAATESVQTKPMLAKAKQNLLHIIEHTGEIIGNLNDSRLMPYGLQAAISQVINQITDVTPVQVNYRYAIRQQLPKDFATHIYAITQELLHNMLQHTTATTVTLHLKESREYIYVYYQDNGAGMPHTKPLHHRKGRGLHNLSNRTQFLAGQMQMRATDKGISYFFEIPIPPTTNPNSSPNTVSHV